MPAFTMTVHNEEDDEISMIDENADPALNGLKSQMDCKELDPRKISTQESVASQKSKTEALRIADNMLVKMMILIFPLCFYHARL